MKKNIVALAVASAIAAPVAMADAPTVYGQVNQALEQRSADNFAGDKVEASSGTYVDNRASRLGVKGSSDLGNGMKAVYKVEFSLGMNGGGVGDRNQYVGLAGGFGTVLMGRHDTPTKMIQAKDLFNDARLSDNRRIGGELGAFGRSMENRVNNVLAYVSPSFGGVKLIAATSPSETSVDGDESSISDLYSVAVAYGSKKEGLYLAAGMDSANENTTGVADTEAQHTRVVAQYATGGLIANAMYQDFGGDAIEDTVREGSNIMANVGYKFGKIMPKVKVSMVDRVNDFEDSTNYAVGVNYSMGKKTTAYAEFAKTEHIGGNAADGSDAEESAFSVGLLHKF
ncbi:porin [Thiomicrospira sp. WB1]|uniref:porin n=1 Tax=Thiomicrospira sp. WB1 TaxID=1685380 RepID=UPI0007485591|nr:porin [Thiomicrospira sp. WB1]KUJ72648.1 hypothetical protein AVO41_02270 [Thiomicrospira sp. WB1]